MVDVEFASKIEKFCNKRSMMIMIIMRIMTITMIMMITMQNLDSVHALLSVCVAGFPS